ncbi:MAG: hypothetical protein WC869_00665 [Phycisphaerae bacterium]|jgi:hypothetical protein
MRNSGPTSSTSPTLRSLGAGVGAPVGAETKCKIPGIGDDVEALTALTVEQSQEIAMFYDIRARLDILLNGPKPEPLAGQAADPQPARTLGLTDLVGILREQQNARRELIHSINVMLS